MTKDEAIKLLNIYGEAWEKQDPDLILTIFTPDAIYNDPKEAENHGHEGIRAYWVSKVVGEEKDIKFKLLNTWVDGTDVIAEYYAEFIDTKRNLNIKMTEVAIITTRDEKFSSLREYYKSEKTPLSVI
ncbi:MAG: nuclear transport factor 2 family protein [Candidatus Yonathbacteria bacterium]|nr:nuclear transport factor 2 family protein [Candidatus Yonathbacteria bacterium]